MIRSRRFFKG
jgi:hypothetical protein